MPRFIQAHATHPDPHMALALVGAQLEGQRAGMTPTLGFLYLTHPYAAHAQALLDEVRLRWPGCGWVGASALAVSASGVEYFDEPALVVMLCDLPADQWRIFSGRQPLTPDCDARSLLLHADGATPDLQELIGELAQRCSSGYLFGGLVSGGDTAVQIADGVFEGGLSGLALGSGLRWISRVSQGCQPLGRERRVTACDGPLVTELDGQPALDALLEDLRLPAYTGESGSLRQAMPLFRRTLVGLNDEPGTRREYGPEVRVRHLVGLDPARRGVAVAEQVRQGELLSFCERHPDAARRTWCASAPRSAPRPRSAARAWPARCTSAAPDAAGRISARRRRNSNGCSTRWARCPWPASSPTERSRTPACTATPAS